jgi:hypothetical protein
MDRDYAPVLRHRKQRKSCPVPGCAQVGTAISDASGAPCVHCRNLWCCWRSESWVSPCGNLCQKIEPFSEAVFTVFLCFSAEFVIYPSAIPPGLWNAYEPGSDNIPAQRSGPLESSAGSRVASARSQNDRSSQAGYDLRQIMVAGGTPISVNLISRISARVTGMW